MFAPTDRTRRIVFFSPSLEPHDPRLRVAENASHRYSGLEAGEPVLVHQTPRSSHSRIVTIFSTSRNSNPPCTTSPSGLSGLEIYPHAWEKTPFSLRISLSRLTRRAGIASWVPTRAGRSSMFFGSTQLRWCNLTSVESPSCVVQSHCDPSVRIALWRGLLRTP